jgi:hypothetical protein
MTQTYDETAIAVPTTDILLEVLLEMSLQEEKYQLIETITEKRNSHDAN